MGRPRARRAAAARLLAGQYQIAIGVTGRAMLSRVAMRGIHQEKVLLPRLFGLLLFCHGGQGATCVTGEERSMRAGFVRDISVTSAPRCYFIGRGDRASAMKGWAKSIAIGQEVATEVRSEAVTTTGGQGGHQPRRG